MSRLLVRILNFRRTFIFKWFAVVIIYSGCFSVFSQGNPVYEPEYPGGMDAFYQFVWTKTDSILDARPPYSKMKGKVVATFTVDANGKPGNFIIHRSNNPELEEVVLQALYLLPNWTPGNVKKDYEIPFEFN